MAGGENKPQLEVLLTCPVCRDIFRDPRQLPCGHSVCMSCLQGLADHSSDLPFRCPDCRATFGGVVKVQKNYALANIVEEHRESKDKRAQQTVEVYCDCCPERKALAVKTCLKCEVSMCREHVMDHLERAVYTGHPLVQPLGDLQQRKCPQHEDEVLKYYCNVSRRYLCNMCALEKKQTNVAVEASGVLGRKLTELIEERFKSLEGKMKESKDSIKKLQEAIQNEKQNVNPNDSYLNSVTGVLLCLWFIVLFYAYSYHVDNQILNESLAKQQTRLYHIYSTITEMLVHHSPQHHDDAGTESLGILTLDLDTASPFLGVTPDFQSVERVNTKLSYPSQQSRFDETPQVLSTQCFTTGTHIWEVEVEGYWGIAVSYRSIQRKHKDNSSFGNNTHSWSLTHNGEGQLYAYHNKIKNVLSTTVEHNRIKVDVNIEEGTITFIGMRPTVTELHQFQAKLTEPVCLGLGLYRVDPPSRASVVKVH
ncbi:E3 ubiquitin-protein ligase TRIM21-like [Lampris incognitus]|uniref:E3 ubiquitin-protein ligase TRIM21-like n=1 Tax=Lampris incognitus TaxID=2546036 RepID=UPI0024B5EDAA|nr:E3 ubiquitin-protein ligase TRIM21-like [Lampris incognitus]XP_056148884.1 E3 ubiquitin-protein ligase TRIM21-like [Lampris incognitus]XP_056148885.1 E3 ubiquitin-protein ligase TRIM21-like [Lampris incognitus]XP_056148886.1 E3 ubiquitin-protein ligase TRIM21-like [Lampris incognitus]XP_056148887.1 E3 ubiquitin-protein ligase TRIM21-like [Lampris incognitus]